MAYAFSSIELSSIEAAYEVALLDGAKWVDVYEAIFDAITDPVTHQAKEGVDPSAWLWVQGAWQVNSGYGDYSTFIRSYSTAQYEARFGEEPDEGFEVALQEASNLVCKKVAQDILTRISSSTPLPSFWNIFGIQEVFDFGW